MLKRTKNKKSGSVKFALPCDDLKTSKDWLEVKGYLASKDFNILLAKIQNLKTVVVKFGTTQEIQKEYNIAKTAFQKKIPNFIKFLCSFECSDTAESIKKRDFLINTSVCRDQIGMIIMPYYSLGNLEKYRWDRSNFWILKNVLHQVVYALLYAYQQFQFVHGYVHVGNVVLCQSKKRVVWYGDVNSLPVLGLYPLIMDFGRSYMQEDAAGQVYKHIDHLLALVLNMKNSDLALDCDRSPLIPLIKRNAPITQDVYLSVYDIIERITIRYATSELPPNPFL